MIEQRSAHILWVYVFILYGVLLLALSVFKSAEVALPTVYGIERWLGGDKWMHFKLSGILAILACFASERVLDLAAIKRTLRVFPVLVLALAIDEALQFLTATRRFEFLDLVWGVSGLLAGALGYLLVVFVRDGVTRH
jgi:glycopeptide antibiotics resistance protein